MKAQRLLFSLFTFLIAAAVRFKCTSLELSHADTGRPGHVTGLFSIYRKSAQRTHQGYRHTPAPVRAQRGQRTSVKTAAVPSDRTGTAAISAAPTSTSQDVKNSQEETFSDPLAQLLSPGTGLCTHTHTVTKAPRGPRLRTRRQEVRSRSRKASGDVQIHRKRYS